MRGEDGADLNEENAYVSPVDRRQFFYHGAKAVSDGFAEVRVAHFSIQITKVLFVFQRNASDGAQAAFHLKEAQVFMFGSREAM